MAEPNAEHRLAFDSDRQHLGGVYAKALLNATEKAGVSETVLEQLEAFVSEVLDKVPQLAALLATPRVSSEEKIRLLDRTVGRQVHPLLLNFFRVTARHGRLDCLRDVLVEARRLFNELRGRVEVIVESAAPLDDSSRAAVIERLQGSLGAQVILRTRVNPDVLGGLVVRVGDTVYDASVANQLNRLRRTVLTSARQKMRDAMPRFAVGE